MTTAQTRRNSGSKGATSVAQTSPSRPWMSKGNKTTPPGLLHRHSPRREQPRAPSQRLTRVMQIFCASGLCTSGLCKRRTKRQAMLAAKGATASLPRRSASSPTAQPALLATDAQSHGSVNCRSNCKFSIPHHQPTNQRTNALGLHDAATETETVPQREEALRRSREERGRALAGKKGSVCSGLPQAQTPTARRGPRCLRSTFPTKASAAVSAEFPAKQKAFQGPGHRRCNLANPTCTPATRGSVGLPERKHHNNHHPTSSHTHFHTHTHTHRDRLAAAPAPKPNAKLHHRGTDRQKDTAPSHVFVCVGNLLQNLRHELKTAIDCGSSHWGKC